MLRWAMIILFGFLMRSFLNLNMSSSGCSTDNFTESDLILETNSSWTGFLALGAGENLFFFLESRSYQNFRIPEIRFVAKLMYLVLFICRPYSFRCVSSMFLWWMQSQSVKFRKSINFLLLMSEFALSTRKTGDKMIIFADGTIFCIKRRSFFMFLNISSGVKWGASLVPTWWTITLSGFFFSRGTAKSVKSFTVAPGKVLTLINFFSTFYILVSLLKLNHPLLRWCLASKWVVFFRTGGI